MHLTGKHNGADHGLKRGLHLTHCAPRLSTPHGRRSPAPGSLFWGYGKLQVDAAQQIELLLRTPQQLQVQGCAAKAKNRLLDVQHLAHLEKYAGRHQSNIVQEIMFEETALEADHHASAFGTVDNSPAHLVGGGFNQQHGTCKLCYMKMAIGANACNLI